jgi:hypothetical protein
LLDAAFAPGILPPLGGIRRLSGQWATPHESDEGPP